MRPGRRRRSPAVAAAVAGLLWAAVPAGFLWAAVPAGAATTSSTTPASSTTTTTPAGPTTTTTIPIADVPAPADEAKLASLIDEVNNRVAALQKQIADLNTQLAQDQATLQADTALLAQRQAEAYAADRRVDALEVDRAAARLSMRTRAVAAYMHQPTDDLATMLLHLRDPADLVDARSFYQDLVDKQVKVVKRFDGLTRSATGAARHADEARDEVKREQEALTAQAKLLQSLKLTYQAVQQESLQQQQQQQQLLTQAGLDRAQFAAEVAAEAAEEAAIEQLLASLVVPGSATATVPAGDAFLSWPIPSAPITSPFGPRLDPVTGLASFHPGIDFGATMGTPIHAAADGTVVYAGPESGYGNFTCVSHGGDIATCYAHQSVILVTLGEQVSRGQVIGLVGSTGYSTGPHLHFEVRIDGKVADPMPWLTSNPEATTTTTTTPPRR
jgi:murein DD-endopeptidase MepM/ murein hydrolase activator NlpD